MRFLHVFAASGRTLYGFVVPTCRRMAACHEENKLMKTKKNSGVAESQKQRNEADKRIDERGNGLREEAVLNQSFFFLPPFISFFVYCLPPTFGHARVRGTGVGAAAMRSISSCHFSRTCSDEPPARHTSEVPMINIF